jgi:hypothetical protein
VFGVEGEPEGGVVEVLVEGGEEMTIGRLGRLRKRVQFLKGG